MDFQWIISGFDIRLKKSGIEIKSGREKEAKWIINGAKTDLKLVK